MLTLPWGLFATHSGGVPLNAFSPSSWTGLSDDWSRSNHLSALDSLRLSLPRCLVAKNPKANQELLEQILNMNFYYYSFPAFKSPLVIFLNFISYFLWFYCFLISFLRVFAPYEIKELNWKIWMRSESASFFSPSPYSCGLYLYSVSVGSPNCQLCFSFQAKSLDYKWHRGVLSRNSKILGRMIRPKI